MTEKMVEVSTIGRRNGNKNRTEIWDRSAGARPRSGAAEC